MAGLLGLWLSWAFGFSLRPGRLRKNRLGGRKLSHTALLSYHLDFKGYGLSLLNFIYKKNKEQYNMIVYINMYKYKYKYIVKKH